MLVVIVSIAVGGGSDPEIRGQTVEQAQAFWREIGRVDLEVKAAAADHPDRSGYSFEAALRSVDHADFIEPALIVTPSPGVTIGEAVPDVCTPGDGPSFHSDQQQQPGGGTDC